MKDTRTLKLMVGTYRTNITPPLGICLEGGFGLVRARDVWQDLYSNALVLDDGRTELALVSLDVCSILTADYKEIAGQIEALTGIPAENVILTATHTHSGPATGFDLDGVYELSPDYISIFKKQVVSSVRLAQLRKQAACMAVGRGENRDYVFNRRLKMPDGSIRMNWGDKKLMQGAIGDGTVDPEVLVLKFENNQGKPVAFVVNYANHNNAAPGDIISADYSGIMADHLRAIYGPDLGVLFLPGAAGNINWVDFKDLNQYSETLYRKIGKSLAGTVLEVESRMEYPENVDLSISFQRPMILERPYREYDAQIDWTFGDPEHAMDFWSAYRKAYDAYKDLPLASHEVDLHVVKFGDRAALCTNPAELFTEFGLEIKRKSPFPYTMVAELTNGSIGYVATPQAFEEGGYEVRKIPGGSFMAVDCGDQIVRVWEALLAK